MEHIELEVPAPVPVAVEPDHTLLVLVDMENEFCHPDGGHYVAQGVEDVLVTTAQMVERARREGWRILWIRSEREADATEFTAFGREPHLVKGTWSVEYTAPLAVGPDEPVISKQSHDCFSRSGLEAWLTSQGIDGPDWTVLVAGVALGVCVNHAVMGFSVRDYRVAVLLDCTAPNTGPAAAATLWRYGLRAYNYNITVTNSGLVTSGGGDEGDDHRVGVASSTTGVAGA